MQATTSAVRPTRRWNGGRGSARSAGWDLPAWCARGPECVFDTFRRGSRAQRRAAGRIREARQLVRDALPTASLLAVKLEQCLCRILPRKTRAARAALAGGRCPRCSSIPICSKWPRSPIASASGGTASCRLLQRQPPHRADERLRDVSCAFCAFGRKATLRSRRVRDDARRRLRALGRRRAPRRVGATEVHIVAGLHPQFDLAWYEEMLRGLKTRFPPGLHLKCFTAVEIAYFAQLHKMTDEKVLRGLMAVGLESMPGGGAEIFADRVRQEDRPRQVRCRSVSRDPQHGARLGIKSNVTMLYGHVESTKNAWTTRPRPRAPGRDDGFQAFIPLAFHPANNQIPQLPAPGRPDTLRTSRCRA